MVVVVEGGGYGSGSDTASRYGMTSGCDDRYDYCHETVDIIKRRY